MVDAVAGALAAVGGRRDLQHSVLMRPGGVVAAAAPAVQGRGFGPAVVVLTRRSRGPVLLEPVSTLHLPGRLQHQLDPVRPLVVDAPATHRFAEVVEHGPGHTGHVAEVAVLPLTHLHYGHFHHVQRKHTQ